ncbi:MAG: 3-dehydroquinate synthase [Betaproteobacteria bacterium]|nr:3-dehydroquinate synthase [Betaproteobacteria bacterium]
MQTLRVALGARSYPIHVGEGAMDNLGLITPLLRSNTAAIVTNVTVAPLYLERFAAALAAAGVQCVQVVLPDGEAYKNWETLNSVYDRLLEAHCDRQTTIIALGGGVVGDIAGFAAATYQRGVSFIQVPTTLLAQVDASVGGKTGINHPLGKNMIGAFHQPLAVLADTSTLRSLPMRELRAGLAEVIKHSLIRDVVLFEWLEANLEKLLAREDAALVHAVLRCCEIKAEIVAADERETGERALLNFGHTFGHAIENAKGYGVWLHGEAVAAGMALAVDLSRRLGGLTAADAARVVELIARAGLPTAVRGVSPQQFTALMGLDKKAAAGRPRFIVLDRLGAASIRDDVSSGDLNDTLATAA